MRRRPRLDPSPLPFDYAAMSHPPANAPASAVLPVAVVGCGRMGQLHARVYSQMSQVKLVGLYDVDPDVAAAARDKYGGEVFTDLDALASQVRAATIAVPTQFHAT